MNPPTLELRPNPRTKNQRLLLTPSQPPGKMRHTKPLKAPSQILIRPQPQLLKVSIFRPRVRRPLPLHHRHVLEAGVAHILFVFCGGEDWAAGGGGGFEDVAAPLGEGAGGVEGLVVAADGDGEFLELEVAAGFQVTKAVSRQGVGGSAMDGRTRMLF